MGGGRNIITPVAFTMVLSANTLRCRGWKFLYQFALECSGSICKKIVVGWLSGWLGGSLGGWVGGRLSGWAVK